MPPTSIREEPDHEHEFIKVDIFNPEQRAQLVKISPVLKIPVLEAYGQVIIDSRVIFNYLVEKGFHPKLSWPRENLLSIVDGACDSLIISLISKRSQSPLSLNTIFGRGHLERISNTFEYLETHVNTEAFKNWDYLSFSLFGLVDWAQFRELFSFEKYPKLLTFWEANKVREDAVQTDPRI